MKLKKTLLFFFMLQALWALGTKPVELNNQDEVQLYNHAQIVNVGDTNFSILEFRKAADKLPFRAVINANENIGFTSDNYWIRFSLHNNSSEARIYFFETARPITDEVNLYQFDDDHNLILKRSGDQIPFSERDFQHRSSIFKLKLQPGETYQYFLHLKSDGEVISLPLALRAPTTMVAKVYKTQLFFGVFYGVIALAAIIYLFFYFGIREVSFLNYGFYVLSIGLLQLSLDGYMFQYIFPGAGWFNSRMVIVAALLSIFFLGRYSETFLHIKSSFRWLSWAFKAIYIFTGLLFIAILISPKFLEASYPLSNQTGLVLLLFIIGSVVAKHAKGEKVDPFYSAGIGFLVLGFVIFILNNLGIIPNNFITENSSKFGSGLEVIFLSISMTNRIRKLKSENEKSQTMALRKSEEMNDIKNYFMSNMSHELRTPLNAIMGLAEQMRNEDQSEETLNSNLDVIKYSSLSLLSSVNDILDFSKIEKGELRLQFDKFDPAKTLEEISENWKVQAREKGLKYVMEIDQNLPLKCRGDTDRLGQIANNILSNAVKFTHDGEVKFEVSAKELARNQTQLQISVKDTGVGIPKEKMDTVFESFLQENINDKRNFGGLGLGLSIVKKLVDLHEGTIELYSDINKGTECRVAIPYEVIEERKAKPTIDLSEKDLKGAHLLIVEDNALNQLVMRKTLGGWQNTTFAVAENGQEALELMQKEDFDLVLMDLQMPVMDGYEATQRIRQGEVSDQFKDIPIVAVTADTMEKTKEKVFALGINEYITKPVKSDHLFEKVALLIFDKKVGSAA